LSTSSLNINVQPIVNLGGGPGVLSGKIVEGVGYAQKGNGILAPGNPIRGVIVKGGRNPGGDIIAQSRTNPNGEYSLTDLPISLTNEEYFILVEIPGLDTNGTHRRSVITGSLQYTGLDFIADSSYIHPVLNVSLSDLVINNFQVKLYPNPSDGIVKLYYESGKNAEISYSIKDLNGRIVLSSEMEMYDSVFDKQIDLRNVSDGIYLLQMIVDGNMHTAKLVISRN